MSINKNILPESIINDIKLAVLGDIGETWAFDCHPDIEKLYIKWKVERKPMGEDDKSAAIDVLKKGLLEFLTQVMPKRIPVDILFYIFKWEFRKGEILPNVIDNLLYRLLKECYGADDFYDIWQYGADDFYDIWQIADKVAVEWSTIVVSLDECLRVDKIMCELSRNYKNLYKDFHENKKSYVISNHAEL